MASSSEDDEEGGLTRPELPDLGADELCQSMRALASSTAGPSSSVKVRAAAVGATLDAHADVSEAVEPHLGQLEPEMGQLNAIPEHKFALVRDATMELLDEFGVESDYKFQTAASENKSSTTAWWPRRRCRRLMTPHSRSSRHSAARSSRPSFSRRSEDPTKRQKAGRRLTCKITMRAGLCK